MRAEPVPDVLSEEKIRAGLATTLIGQELVYLAETGSTNDVARTLAQGGAADGLLVIADHQTAGKGRLQRRWMAPPGSSLLMSILFRAQLPPTAVHQLTMICGLAVCDAVAEQTCLQAALKWPNDVLLGWAKVGGILTELEFTGSEFAYAIVGCGLNVNLHPSSLPRDLMMEATSLSWELGRPVPRLPLLLTFLTRVEERYCALRAGQSPHLEWSEKLATLGQRVWVWGGDRSLQGVAEGVDSAGALLLRLDDGQLERVLAGDVSLRFGQTRSDLL